MALEGTVVMIPEFMEDLIERVKNLNRFTIAYHSKRSASPVFLIQETLESLPETEAAAVVEKTIIEVAMEVETLLAIEAEDSKMAIEAETEIALKEDRCTINEKMIFDHYNDKVISH